MSRTSRNGNKYARLSLQDEIGEVQGLFMDTRNEEKLTNFLSSGKKLPKKGDIVIIYGSKSDQSVFVNSLRVLEDKIYMKLSEVK
jgi:hypothetical protein